MRRSRRLVAVAVALAGVVGLTVLVSSGAGSSGPVAKQGRVSTGAKMTVRRRSGLRVVYLAASGIVQPRQNVGHRGRCPRSTPHPVSGFLSSDGLQVVLTDSAPVRGNARRNRDWGVAIVNLSVDQPANYTVGVVCLRAR